MHNPTQERSTPSLSTRLTLSGPPRALLRKEETKADESPRFRWGRDATSTIILLLLGMMAAAYTGLCVGGKVCTVDTCAVYCSDALIILSFNLKRRNALSDVRCGSLKGEGLFAFLLVCVTNIKEAFLSVCVANTRGGVLTSMCHKH